MIKRYFAKDRLAWGKRHLAAGDELVDPPVSEQQALADMLVKGGAVRVAEEAEPKKKPPTYKRRDLVAETPKEPPPTDPAPAPELAAEEPPRRRGRIGAMTTGDEPGITNKSE